MTVKDFEKKLDSLEARINAGSDNLDDYFDLGKLYFDRGDFKSFIELYELALKLPLNRLDRATVILELGRVYESLGEQGKCTHLYKEALTILGDERDSAYVIDLHSMCHYNLAVHLGSHDDVIYHAEQALAGFTSLIERYPGYDVDKGVIYSHMGELYLMLGREEEALIAYKLSFEHSSENEGQVWSLNGMAAIYRRLGRLQEAEESYRQALVTAKSKSLYSKNHYDLGEVLEMKGQDLAALGEFHKALLFRVDDVVLRSSNEYLVDILWSIGSVNYRLGNCEETLKHLERVISMLTENHRLFCNTHIIIGHCFVEQGYFKRASIHYNKALFSPLATKEEIEVANDSLKDIETEHNA